MSSRQEQKAQLRREREERAAAERAAAARRKRLITLGTASAVLVVVAIVAVVALSGGSEKSKIGKQLENGLQISPGPWPPEYNGLPARLKALALPDPSDEIYHVHSQLTVYVNGKKEAVPANVGVDQQHQILASLHTHDAKGVIHQEAVQPYPFTLGQFFEVWGVKFTPTQLGAYRPGKGLVLETYVNGKLVPNGPAYKMKSHDLIVVGFGEPGSFPKKSNFKFPPGE
ncbi:MAG TPA: hypothetical protein VF545_09540 [Thermoleophilaceae bacterium]|jgi:hypothetical protein